VKERRYSYKKLTTQGRVETMKLCKAITMFVFCCIILVYLPRTGHCEERKEVKIGVMAPLSGPLAPYGKAVLEGVRMRVEEANEKSSGLNYTIKLCVEDNMENDTTTISVYNKLAGSDRVCAVIGPLTSTCALAVRRAVAKLKVPLITPTATNDKVTRDNDYMFRACFNDSFQGRVIATHVVKEMKKAATLVDMNSDYSKGLAKSFGEFFQKLGGQVVAEEKYQQKDTDFAVQLKKILGSGAEIVFVPGYPPEVPLIIKQAKAVGLSARLCGADGWDNEAVINGSGDNIEGSLIVGAFSPDDTRPQVQKFVEAFKKRSDKRPGTFEALGYDSVSLIIEALKSGTKPEDVKRGLSRVKNFDAVTGTITIDENGDAIKSAVILKITRENGKYGVKYVTTVNP
jgi:branched-chain amino acid transport system substrate-binding protein